MAAAIADQLVQGVLLGGLYCMFALGLSLTVGVLRFVNIAHGDLIVLAAVKDAARRFAVAFRPSLTAAARGALELSGRDEETAAFSRTRKHNELGSQG